MKFNLRNFIFFQIGRYVTVPMFQFLVQLKKSLLLGHTHALKFTTYKTYILY